MAKYRIVHRPSSGLYCYFAQKKWFNLFWIDISGGSTSGGPGYPNGAENPSHSQELVEKYIEFFVMRPPQQTVVKTYE